MSTPSPKPKALCVVTRCTSVDQFVATFHRFCGEDQTFFVATMTSRPIGLETAFSIQLADKQPVLRGLCVVLDAWETPDNRYKRPGIRLGIKRLTADSQLVFDRLKAASRAPEPIADATPPPSQAPLPPGSLPARSTLSPASGVPLTEIASSSAPGGLAIASAPTPSADASTAAAPELPRELPAATLPPLGREARPPAATASSLFARSISRSTVLTVPPVGPPRTPAAGVPSISRPALPSLPLLPGSPADKRASMPSLPSVRRPNPAAAGLEARAGAPGEIAGSSMEPAVEPLVSPGIEPRAGMPPLGTRPRLPGEPLPDPTPPRVQPRASVPAVPRVARASVPLLPSEAPNPDEPPFAPADAELVPAAPLVAPMVDRRAAAMTDEESERPTRPAMAAVSLLEAARPTWQGMPAVADPDAARSALPGVASVPDRERSAAPAAAPQTGSAPIATSLHIVSRAERQRGPADAADAESASIARPWANLPPIDESIANAVTAENPLLRALADAAAVSPPPPAERAPIDEPAAEATSEPALDDAWSDAPAELARIASPHRAERAPIEEPALEAETEPALDAAQPAIIVDRPAISDPPPRPLDVRDTVPGFAVPEVGSIDVSGEVRTPGSPLILPANPLQDLTDESLEGFVDCTLYEATDSEGIAEGIGDVDDWCDPTEPAVPLQSESVPPSAPSRMPAPPSPDPDPEVEVAPASDARETREPMTHVHVHVHVDAAPPATAPVSAVAAAADASAVPVLESSVDASRTVSGEIWSGAPSEASHTMRSPSQPRMATPLPRPATGVPVGFGDPADPAAWFDQASLPHAGESGAPPAREPVFVDPSLHAATPDAPAPSLHAAPMPSLYPRGPVSTTETELVAVPDRRQPRRPPRPRPEWQRLALIVGSVMIAIALAFLFARWIRGPLPAPRAPANHATARPRAPALSPPSAAADPASDPAAAEADPADEAAQVGSDAVVGSGPCRLTVAATPAGSTVRIDDQAIGTSPITAATTCDKHRIDVIHARYQSATRWLTLATPQPQQLEISLARPIHAVTVASFPPGAELSIDGRRAGTTPTVVQLTGFATVNLTFTKPGFPSVTRRLYSKLAQDRVFVKLAR